MNNYLSTLGSRVVYLRLGSGIPNEGGRNDGLLEGRRGEESPLTSDKRKRYTIYKNFIVRKKNTNLSFYVLVRFWILGFEFVRIEPFSFVNGSLNCV